MKKIGHFPYRFCLGKGKYVIKIQRRLCTIAQRTQIAVDFHVDMTICNLSGVIKRIALSADLKEKVSKATPATLPGVYAEAGIWYDALSLLSDQIDAQPGNKALRETRADLLRQVGLKAAAGSEAVLTKN